MGTDAFTAIWQKYDSHYNYPGMREMNLWKELRDLCSIQFIYEYEASLDQNSVLGNVKLSENNGIYKNKEPLYLVTIISNLEHVWK